MLTPIPHCLITKLFRYRINSQFTRSLRNVMRYGCQLESVKPVYIRYRNFSQDQKIKLPPRKYSEVELWMLSSYHEPIIFSSISHERFLFGISGEGARSLIDGLITNDLALLDSTENVIFTYALNPKGRILYEMLIYRFADVAPLLDSPMLENFSGTDENYVIECDYRQMDDLIRHFQVYKLRRKLKFVKLDELNLFTVYPTPFISDNSPVYKVFNDPRNSILGSRILMKKNDHVEEHIKNLISVPTNCYRDFLNHHAIPQGPIDIPPGKYLPLQLSGDLMNGISFSKGCYLGQELTTRTHFTGNVRKRILSLRCNISSPHLVVEPGFEIVDSNDPNYKAMGKVVNFNNQLSSGLGLVNYGALRDHSPAIRIQPERIEPIVIYPPIWWNKFENSKTEVQSDKKDVHDCVEAKGNTNEDLMVYAHMGISIQNLKFTNEI